LPYNSIYSIHKIKLFFGSVFLVWKWLDWNMRCEKLLVICFIPVSRIWAIALYWLPESPLLNWHDELFPWNIESCIFCTNLLSHFQQKYASRSQWVW
jgi:hypothetical protein